MVGRLPLPVIALAAAFLLLALGILLNATAPETAVNVSVAKGGPTLPAFRLVDQFGDPVTDRDVIGKPSLFFFGFTHCPDVCPTVLASLTASLAKVGTDGDRLKIYFVTVDPDRDTSPVLRAYLSSFDSRIRGLTGPTVEIAKLAKALGIYFARADAGGKNYTVDHSAIVVQVDTRGRFFGTIAFDEAPDTIVEKMKRLVREGSR